MKPSQRLHQWIICIAALIPSVSFAYPLFTYTSDELPLIEGYLNGEPRDISMLEDFSMHGFSVSFFGDSDHSRVSFASANFKVSVFPGYEQSFTAAPITNGGVTLNEAGIVTAWNFALSLTYKNFDFNSGPDHQTWVVRSEYGDNTCNCDSVTNGRDLFMPRAYYQWSYYATLGELYIGENDTKNWSITSVNVTEPPIGLIMLCSLFCLGVTRYIRTESAR